MGPTTVNNLPAHVLFVHFVVVFVPLTALLIVLSAVWPATRRRLGVITPIVALITLVSVPLTTSAGKWLERRVQPDPLVKTHAQLGDDLLPWAAGLFVVAVAVWVLNRWSGRRTEESEAVAPGATARWVRVTGAAVAVLAIVVSAGSVWQVYQIGDSGAKAAWHDNFSANPRPRMHGN